MKEEQQECGRQAMPIPSALRLSLQRAMWRDAGCNQHTHQLPRWGRNTGAEASTPGTRQSPPGLYPHLSGSLQANSLNADPRC